MENDVDASVRIHRAAREALKWVSENELDSSHGARALMLAAATLAKASGARHKGWKVTSEQAWDRVTIFEKWLRLSTSKPGWLMMILNVLGLRVDADRE